jgi:hypothetical protein
VRHEGRGRRGTLSSDVQMRCRVAWFRGTSTMAGLVTEESLHNFKNCVSETLLGSLGLPWRV